MVDDVYFFFLFSFIKSVVAVEVCCPGDVVSCSCCVCVCVCIVGRCVVFTVAHIEICDVIPLFYVFGFSSLALYPCEFHVQACKMHHQHPFVSWQMFQQRALHIVWQPTIKTKYISIKISIKIDNNIIIRIIIIKMYNSLTSLAWFISTAHACKSHLLPTSTIGTSSASLTRFICSRYVPLKIQLIIHSFYLHLSSLCNIPISSKLLALFTANTNRNPSPVRIYWSRMAEYSSWPAVSKMSNKHVSPSVYYKINIIIRWCSHNQHLCLCLWWWWWLIVEWIIEK